MVFSAISTVIGKTPLIPLATLAGGGQIYAKHEYKNPSGSVKDRTALYLLRGALMRGELTRGGRVIEASSGNLGISLAMLSAAEGLAFTAVMPEGVSREREAFIRAYGGEVAYSAREDGMAGAMRLAEELSARTGAYYTRQFENPDGVLAHYETTGREIFSALGDAPDVLVCGVGSGGTISGTGRYLKERGGCEVVAIEPSSSAVLSGGAAGQHGIAGIGAGFVPPVLERGVIDRVITVSDGEAKELFNSLPRRYGIACGFSSGAAVAAAMRLARMRGYCDKRIVVILPDGRDRYLFE